MKRSIIASIILLILSLCYVDAYSQSERKPRTPTITSEWKRIVYYPHNHLNDFCFFLDREKKTWHAIGIMGTGKWASEVSLFHSTCNDLLTPFVNRSPILTVNPGEGLNPQKHAPSVVWHDGSYHLFYRRPGGTILHMKSKDPNNWIGLGEFIFEENDARDVCVIDVNGMFYMYYCQFINLEGKNRSSILLRKSPDLEKWSQPIISYVDLEFEDNHSKLESPFVVKEKDGYYLFITYRPNETTKTIVLFSENPDKFPSGIRTWFEEINDVHAGEIVKYKNKYYLARVCNDRSIPEGWLEIAELKFK